MKTNMTDMARGGIIILIGALTGCAGILDGPFNQDGVMVPELLNANNGSGYVTYWDDRTKSYRTYDQVNNVHLEQVAYSLDSVRTTPGERRRIVRESRNFMISGNVVVPMTHLDTAGMAIQKEEGCKGCHRT